MIPSSSLHHCGNDENNVKEKLVLVHWPHEITYIKYTLKNSSFKPLPINQIQNCKAKFTW